MGKRLAAALLTVCMLAGMVPAVCASGFRKSGEETWLSDTSWYYRQLNGEDRAAWDMDVENILRYPAQQVASTPDRQRTVLTQVIRAENPRLFWVDWIDSYGRLCFYSSTSRAGGNYFAPRWPRGSSLEDLQEKYLHAVDRDAQQIRQALAPSFSRYDAVKEIVDWICENSTYNSSQTGNNRSTTEPVDFAWLAAHSSYAALVTGDAYEPVCEGYALAFKVLCEEMDVPCLCVAGSTSFAESHMWNLVQMEDGTWHLVDVAGVDRKEGAPYTYSYFMIGAQQAEKMGYEPDPVFGSRYIGGGSSADDPRFSVPDIAEGWRYVLAPELTVTETWGGACVRMEGRNPAINSGYLYLLYTTDGKDPTLESPSCFRHWESVYNGEVSRDLWLEEDTPVKSILQVGSNGTVANGFTPWQFRSFSDVSALQVQVGETDRPVITGSGEDITITAPASASEEVRIYYTTDGSDPLYRLQADGRAETNPAQSLYSGSFSLEEGAEVRAIAVDRGSRASLVVSCPAGSEGGK